MERNLLREALRRPPIREDRPAKPTRWELHQSHRLESLEPRLLLAADLAAGLDVPGMLGPQGPASTLFADEAFKEAPLRPGHGTTTDPSDSAPATPIDLDALGNLYSGITSVDDQAHVRRELIIVDESVEGHEQLINDLLARNGDGRQIEIQVLDRRRDGIEQISEVLKAYQDLDAIHLLSHGSEGALQLGDTRLDHNTLEERAALFRGWGQSMNTGADLLLYGCDLAGDSDGKALVRAISQLTGTDVAASNDLTGNVLRGGDWDLEYRSGDIETQIALDHELQKGFDTTLAIESIKDEFTATSFAGNDGSLNWANSWQEIGEADGESLGSVQIKPGAGFTTNHLEIRANVIGSGASRSVDLSDAHSATLSFDFRRTSAGGTVELQISDGGAPVTLKTYVLNFTDPSPVSDSFDISAHLSATTQISFIVTDAVNGLLRIDNVQIVAANDALLLSTEGDVSAGGQPGTDTFEKGDVVQIGDPNLNYGNALTSGTFALAFDVDLFASGANTDGVHFVTSDIQVGSSDFQLKAGDVLLSTDGTENFSSGSTPPAGFTNNLTVSDGDVLVFRPDTVGDFSAGTFALLLDDLTGGNGVRDFALIERTTTVGDATLQAGDFLFTSSTGDNDVFLFETTNVGVGTTSGSISTLIEGDDISVNNKIVGLHLLDSTATVGGKMLGTGSLLLAVDAVETLGDNNLSVSEFDIAVLNVTQTTLVAGAGNAAATAARFFDGADVNFDDSKISGVTFDDTDTLWLTTEIDVSLAGTPGIEDWQSADLVKFTDPNLAFESGGTDGTASVAFDIELFAPGKDLNALHLVDADIQVGASTFQLKAGDLLISIDDAIGATFISASSPPPGFTNNLTVAKSDVLVFRPDTVGDYASGSFAMLLEDPTSGGHNIRGITLVQQDTTVGDITLQAGDFLFTRSGGAEDNDVWLFQTTDVGAGNTNGAASVLIEGDDVGVSISKKIFGIELVEENTTIGGRSLTEGTLLLTVDTAESVGANDLQVTEHDIFALDVTNTTLAAGTNNAIATATPFFEGDNLSFNDSAEPPDALSLTTGDNSSASINQEPAGADNTISTDEDLDHIFNTADFGFSDLIDSNALLAVKITTLPAGGTGTLTLNGVALSIGQIVTATDIALNLLKYEPPNNLNGAGLASFTFQVQDDGGTGNGGVDLDQSANTITIDVDAVNDEPAGADNTINTDEDIDHIFNTADFGFSDPIDSNALLAVKITTLPAGGTGTLTLNGVALSIGQIVTATDIALNLLKYEPPSNLNGAGLASFTFQVQDDGGTGNGGVDLDQSANTITIDVDAVNDEPAGADKTISTDEDLDHIFNTADFGFSDLIDSNALLAVKITTLPAGGTGTLTLNGVALSIGQTVAATDIALNLLKYEPPSNLNGAGLASFTFQVQDDGGTGNGGVDLDQSANTITIDVDAVNDEPAGADKTVAATVDTDFTFTVTDFGYNDPADGNLFLSLRISSLPIAGAGTLALNGVDVVVGQFVSALDIDNELFKYTPPAATRGAGVANFTFQVQDDGGTANGGVNLDQTPNTITIDVDAAATPPVDPPVVLLPDPDPDPEPEPEPEPEPDPEPEPEPEPEPDPEPDPELDPEPEPDPELDPEPDPEPEGPVVGTGPVTGPVTLPGVNVIPIEVVNIDIVAPDNLSDNAGPVQQSAQRLLAALAEAVSAQLDLVPEGIVEAVAEEVDDLRQLVERGDFFRALDEVKKDVALSSTPFTQTVIGTSTAATTVLSVGYVAWLARGGLLISSFLSSMPAWRLIDPIPVLARIGEEDEEHHQESLYSLLEAPARPPPTTDPIASVDDSSAPESGDNQ